MGPDEAFARWLDGHDADVFAGGPPPVAPGLPSEFYHPGVSSGPFGEDGFGDVEVDDGFDDDAASDAVSVRAADAASVPTGSLGLDLALGTGGWTRGHLIELFGEPGSGKTTLSLMAVASVQAAGGNAALIDAEHALDPARAERLGVDLSSLPIVQPDSGEQALAIGEMLLQSGGVDLLVVDSIAALTPRAELDAGVGMMPSGLQAALVSQALRRWSAAARRTHATVLMLNQIRFDAAASRRGVEYDATAGGRSLRFYAAQRVSLTVRGVVRAPGRTAPVGIRVTARVEKNRRSLAFGEASFDLLFSGGVDRTRELAEAAVSTGWLAETPEGWVWAGPALGWPAAWRGVDGASACSWLAEHPRVARALESALIPRHPS